MYVLDRKTPPLTPAAIHATIQAITSAPIPIGFDVSGHALLGPGGAVVVAGRSLIEATPERTVVPVLALWRVEVANIAERMAYGRIVPKRVEEVPGGLAEIKEGLAKLQRREVSGAKLVGHSSES
ncbi:hypothetical protein B0H17DRAFT_1213066 [Mycena rosella]|uniref:Uncharacterized protein n=1 Tax=Mycena rosella TaxID=1033263 RepID=A0AAD7G1R8_MYCRO|nr:hypothetical protein B0H17DRAFT_1213066 [Mycena rosella]